MKRLAVPVPVLIIVVSLVAALATAGGCSPVSRPRIGAPLTSADAPAAAPATALEASRSVTFAIIGDYGTDDASERAVAGLVASHQPHFVITTGDNYYSEAGGLGTARYDRSVGTYYDPWLKNTTALVPQSARGTSPINDFFPTLGNHDYRDAKGPQNYLTYFDLPGAGYANTSANERYYEYVQGPVHFFALNSNPQELSGTDPASAQGQWLQRQLAASTSPWKVVYFHHPPYSSDAVHGPTLRMQWPFAAWGADVVLSGHVHAYERIARDGIVYFVNGAGGERPLYHFGSGIDGSQVRYNTQVGAQIATASETALKFEFITADGQVIDSWTITAPTDNVTP